MLIRTTSAVREKSRQTMNGYNGHEPKRYLSKFTALAAELREKKESDNKIIIRKNQVALEKAKKQKQLPQLFLGNVYGISEQIEKIGV